MRTLDRKIDIERFIAGQDDTGQETQDWEKIATRISAAVRPISGDERFTADQFVARQQTEFRIRYFNDVADLDPMDRIIYPASGDSPVPESQVYDIMEVIELGRRDGLSIKAARRAENA